MKRIEFIKSLGLGAGALMLYPGSGFGRPEDKLIVIDDIQYLVDKAHQTIADFINNDRVIVKSDYTLITLVVPVDLLNYNSLENARHVLFKNKTHPNCTYIGHHRWQEPEHKVFFEFKTQMDKIRFINKLNPKQGDVVSELSIRTFFERGKPSELFKDFRPELKN